MIQAGYFFISSALWFSDCWPAASMSSSSKAKNTGSNGEFLFSVSMSIDDSVSEAIGSDGTATGSCTGSGGAGARDPPVEVDGGGETGGRATGGFFLPHAPVSISAIIATTTTVRLCFIVSAFSLVPLCLSRLYFSLLAGPHPRSRSLGDFAPRSGRRRFAEGERLLRPVRIPVHSSSSDLLQVVAIPIDQENLRLAGSRRRERDVPSIGRERRALVAADAISDRLARRRCHIVEPDVEAGPGL